MRGPLPSSSGKVAASSIAQHERRHSPLWLVAPSLPPCSKRCGRIYDRARGAHESHTRGRH